MVTLTEIITTVRELTFDRFIIPGLALKGVTGRTLTITPTQFLIKNGGTTIVDIDLTTVTTFEQLANALVAGGVIISYTPYFNGDESTVNLMPVNNVSIAQDYSVFRKYFFSDTYIQKEIEYYYYQVLNLTVTSPLADVVQLLKYPSERHLIYWVSYYLVEKRRLYEAASTVVGSTYTDGSNYAGSQAQSNNLTDVTVQIGSVFTLREDPTNGFFVEDFNRVGSDNVLGDKYSFWYRLMLFLREKIELEFKDYSLRPDNVVVSGSILEKDLNFRAYFDSYPFTISPLSRNILSESSAFNI